MLIKINADGFRINVISAGAAALMELVMIVQKDSKETESTASTLTNANKEWSKF